MHVMNADPAWEEMTMKNLSINKNKRQLMKKRSLLSLWFAAAATLAGMSAPVSPGQAVGIASDFLNSSTRNDLRRASGGKLSVCYTHADRLTGTNTLYAVSLGRQGGYVLVSADDAAPAVIGYSERGAFDSADIPDNMRVMLDNWSAQIAWLASHPDASPLASESTGVEVAPLLGETKWDQGDPYNRKCPTVAQDDGWGNISGYGPAATGCVATALGQIMYYHKWPETAHGIISYISEGQDPEGGTENVEVSVYLEGTQYQWDKMLPSLTAQSSAESIDAVSSLLFHVGAAFHSIYGVSTGATDVSVAPAMMDNFGYDKGINYVKRDYYDTDEWNSMLMAELQAGRPVAYGGVTRRSEGHFFVLDGVDMNGYFHVNWGWSGMEDGYYRLTLLEPGSQGIGGSSDGSAFSYAQNMIIGIRPPVEGSQLNYNFTVESLSDYNRTIGRQESAAVGMSGVWNDSPNAVIADLGFALYDAEGNVVYAQYPKKNVNYPVAYGESEIKCGFLIPDDVPAGEYTLRPVFRISADDYEAVRKMQVFHGRADAYDVTVTDENITYSTAGAYKLTILGARGDNGDVLESGVTKRITVKFRNDGREFYGPVQLRMYINGKDRVFGRTDFPSSISRSPWITIPANSESEVTFDVGEFTLPGHDDYVIALPGDEGVIDSESGRPVDPYIIVKQAGFKVVGPDLPPVCELEDDMIITTKVDGNVPLNDVGLKICLTNEGGEWTGRMRAAINDPDVWRRDPLGYVTFDPVTIPAETEEIWLTLTGGELPSVCEPGHKYELTLYDPVADEAIIPSYYFSVEFVAGPAIEKLSELTLDEIVFPEDGVVSGQENEIQFTISNTGYPYSGPLYFTISRNETELYASETKTASIGRDDSATIEFSGKIELPAADGNVLALIDRDRNTIGSKVFSIISAGIGGTVADDVRLVLDNGGRAVLTGATASVIEAFSTDGRKVASARGNKLDLSGLSAGSYIVTARTAERVITLKIIL